MTYLPINTYGKLDSNRRSYNNNNTKTYCDIPDLSLNKPYKDDRIL